DQHAGEWPINLDWKPEASWPAYAGWVRAIRRGQARVSRGLSVQAPVLMITSTRTGSESSAQDVRTTDVVLDVERLRRKVTRVSRHVTVAQVEGAIHDVTLSPSPVREVVFDELDRWLSAYVER
ncbi:MAG: alpha/beta hydrolase, partial [Marmoricola sp.]|nr:alpha/beta hydrolase [Marmoricola sp.]